MICPCLEKAAAAADRLDSFSEGRERLAPWQFSSILRLRAVSVPFEVSSYAFLGSLKAVESVLGSFCYRPGLVVRRKGFGVVQVDSSGWASWGPQISPQGQVTQKLPAFDSEPKNLPCRFFAGTQVDRRSRFKLGAGAAGKCFSVSSNIQLGGARVFQSVRTQSP